MLKIMKAVLCICFIIILAACDKTDYPDKITQISGPSSAGLGVKGPDTIITILINDDSHFNNLFSTNLKSTNTINDIRVVNISPAAPGLSVSDCVSNNNNISSCDITLSSDGSIAPGLYTLTIKGTNTSVVTTYLTVAYPTINLSNSIITDTSQEITLTNNSEADIPLDVTHITASSPGWSITDDTCSGSGMLDQNESCTFTINSANATPDASSEINVSGDYFSAPTYPEELEITTTPEEDTVDYTEPSQASDGEITFSQSDITFQVDNTSADPDAISIPVNLTYDNTFAGGLTVSTSGDCTPGSGDIDYYVPANGDCSITVHAANINTPETGSLLTFEAGSTTYLYNLEVPGVTSLASVQPDYSANADNAYKKITVSNTTNSAISNMALNYSSNVTNIIENAAPSSSGESATNCPTGSSNPLASGGSCYFWLHGLKQNSPSTTSGQGLTVSVAYTSGGVSHQTNTLPVVATTYLYAIGYDGIYAWDGKTNDNWQTLAVIGNGMFG